MPAIQNMIRLHANGYDEYSFWRGRWVYRRTVDFRYVTLQ